MRYWILSLFVFSLLATPSWAGAKKSTRPNVLILIADDWSWPHAGIYGDKVVKTPTFDKVAREGVLFHRAYCVAPSCTPSRASLLTGQWAHRLQEGGNLWGTLPRQHVTFADLLARAGYFAGSTRKGWGPGNFKDAGREHNPAGPQFKDFAAFLKARPKDQPFCFWFGSTDPHRPYEKGSGEKAGMKTKDVKVPGFWPDSEIIRSDILDYYVEVERFDREVGEILEMLEKSGEADNTIVIVISDNGMPFPRCKANLYDYGTHMPMVVRWPAQAKAGKEVNAFVSFQDIAPTLLEAAKVEMPKQMTGRSLLDILTTDKKIEGRDHVFVERERHANVRQGNASYPCRAIRTEDFLYIVNFRPDRWPAGDPETFFAVGPYGDIDGSPSKQFILTLQGKKMQGLDYFDLSCGKRPAEELYDLKKDPFETVNVANEAKYKEAKAELRQKLDRWMKETGDPRAAPNGGDDRWDMFKYYGAPVGKKKQDGKAKMSSFRFPGRAWEPGPLFSIPGRAWEPGRPFSFPGSAWERPATRLCLVPPPIHALIRAQVENT
jgi:N-sulfoglucosamine sulfohydrolase